MNRLKSLTIAILALALVLIPGLGARVSAQTPVTVKVWMHIHPPRVELDKQITAQFEKDNPNIKIDFKWVPDQDWDTTLTTGLASGAGPELDPIQCPRRIWPGWGCCRRGTPTTATTAIWRRAGIPSPRDRQSPRS